MASTESDDSRHPLPEGSALGRTWKVLELVGEDHLSVRYKVRGTQLGNVCLARVFTARRCLDDPAMRSAIRDAALAQSRVTHAGVLAVRDIFSLDTTQELVVVTDFIEGSSVAAWLANHGALAEDEAGDIVRQVLSAFIACHRKGLLHLNLRPRCLTLASEGGGDDLRVVVDDFGLPTEAEGDDPGAARAPEQHGGGALDERTDVYAVGALYYELLTGEPLDAERGASELRAMLPTLPLTIERVVRRALAADPAERFANARAMRAALTSDSAILSAKSMSPSSSRVGIEAVERPSQRPSMRGLVAVGGLLLALLVGWLAWRGWQVTTEAEPPAESVARGETGTFVGFDPRTMFAAEPDPTAELPEITADDPVPVAALPSVGTTPALVDLVVVTSLDSLYASPLVMASLVEPLQVRYGDNVRVAWLVLPERSRPGSLERARAALAAQRQRAFLDYADLLARMPGVHDRQMLVALAGSLGLDARRFDVDLDAVELDQLVTHHESLAQQLVADSAGQIFVNARPIEYGADAPRVISEDLLIAAVDAELDAVQRALAEHVSPDAVAAHRTRANLEARRRENPDPVVAPTGPATARRLRVSLDGLPGLGASNAPLSVVVYADLTRPDDRATLDQLEAFYQAHADLVRLVVKLAPDVESQPAFDLAMRLMAAHAAGGFWRALEEQILPATPGDAPQADLLRSRLIEHDRELEALDHGEPGGALVLANGRVIDSSPEALTRGLEEERRLVERFVAAGIARGDIQEAVTESSEPLATSAEQQPGRFLVANWQALPRSGPVEASIIVFWRFSLLDEDWRTTLSSLRRLREAFDDRVAIVLAPAPPGDVRDSDPTFELFVRWWGKPSADIDSGLEALAAAAEMATADPADVLALVERVVPRPRPRPSEARTDDEDVQAPDPDAADAAAAAAAAEARVRDVIGSHAVQWTAEDAAVGSVVIAWRRGLSFVGWTLPGGLAFEPYWDAVRRALQRQTQ